VILKSTGALLSRLREEVRWGALFIFGALLIAGCRDTQGPDTGSSGEPFNFRLARGTTFTLTRWQLDGYGYRIMNSDVQRYWTVVDDSVWAKGWNGVTVVLDSVAGVPGDTLLFCCTASGDIYQYGFLSGVTERLLGRTIPSHWDLLASFSRGMQSSWTVGTGDSLGTQTVTGQTTGSDMLFEIRVNGVSTMFPAYRVEILTDEIACTYWISEAPSAFTYLREELFMTSDPIGGQVNDLTEIHGP
jgi:hypothetical protein